MTRLDRFLAAAVVLAALIVYGLTLTPSLSYLSPDGSELATIPYVLGLAHSPGYPLYTWLGFLFSHLIPLGDVAYRINLMSAVMAALAAGGVYLILIRLLPEGIALALRRAAAVLAGLLLAFSKTFWAQALIAEVYAPNAAGIALTLLALLGWERTRRKRDFFLFALVFGLSLGLHLSDLGFAPAFILFILLSIFEPAAGHAEGGAARHIGKLSERLRSLAAAAVLGLLGFALGAAQFAWLPLRAGTLNDRMMLRAAPTTLAGIYNYTLGAFPNFKFAFPLTALPDRLVIYLDLLNQQFGLAGIALGILGLFSLLARRTRHFFLLVGMYLVEIVFFIQYSAFDLDVFFIPAHLLWALFIGFGLFEIVRAARFVWTRRPQALRPRQSFSSDPAVANTPPAGVRSAGSRFAAILLGCLLVLFAGPSLRSNWPANDFSGDTAVNDFYAGVWSLLPENSALITQSGVFGYDAFYWRLVYGTRADVLLPMLPGPNASAKNLAGRDLFATTRALAGNQGPGALPAGRLRGEYWSLPVLFGQQPEESFSRRETLVLYRLRTDPPPLLEPNPRPQFPADQDFGPARLVGFDLSSQVVESGAILALTLYWKLQNPSALRVETRLGELALEQHEVGFGLLSRYAQITHLPMGSVISDAYGVIIPSGMPPGSYAFTIRSAGLGGAAGNSVSLAPLDVVNETGTMERWLQIAGT
ncbi:MAG: DUF2723 domain-containing protein [Anaerolineales bacterium]|nr:DUF2723 domain-containing protein [Anaerolineales bacterium]